MSNHEPSHRPERSSTAQRALLTVTVAILLAIFGTYAAAGSWATAAGVLTGGGLVLVLMWVAARRAARRGADAATAERVFSGKGDERDHRVYLWTMAVVGLVAFLASALLPVAVQLGLDAETAVKYLPYLFIVTGVAAFIVTDRRI